jgi:protein MpaA
LLVVGGVHGNEPSGVEAALEMVAALRASPPAAPVWIIPALNPDGVAANTKNSASDVDVNRNFPARNFTTVHEPRYDPGPSPVSEPEVRALCDLVDRASPWGVVALHAPFACINYDGPAAAWAAAVAAASGWPVREDIGYPTPGSLGSWLGHDRGIPVLTIEFPPGDLAAFATHARAALAAAVAWTPGATPG